LIRLAIYVSYFSTWSVEHGVPTLCNACPYDFFGIIQFCKNRVNILKENSEIDQFQLIRLKTKKVPRVTCTCQPSWDGIYIYHDEMKDSFYGSN
jgi:hypothetical protein